MAFCVQCGSPVEGGFCSKCGAKVDAPEIPGAQIPPPAPAASPIVIPPATAQKPKKGHFLFWALGGCLGLILVAVIISFFAFSYFAHRVGLDSRSLTKNPGIAIAKVLIGSNPDVELISADEDSGVIRVRDKKTGKTMTVDLENAKKGRIVFTDEHNQQVEIKTQGEGDNSTVEIRSADGNMRIGTGDNIHLPGWLPPYPNAESSGATTFNTNQGKSGACSFRSKDSVEKIAAFYEQALKSAGFQIEKSLSQIPGQGSIAVISASDSKTGRTANMTAARTEEGTSISLAYETR